MGQRQLTIQRRGSDGVTVIVEMQRLPLCWDATRSWFECAHVIQCRYEDGHGVRQTQDDRMTSCDLTEPSCLLFSTTGWFTGWYDFLCWGGPAPSKPPCFPGGLRPPRPPALDYAEHEPRRARYMYYDHGTCTYHERSTCMYHDHAPGMLWHSAVYIYQSKLFIWSEVWSSFRKNDFEKHILSPKTKIQ